MRSIALANQKGGVGKTTTAIHIAHGLALAGQRVVLFDLDPQGNATVALQGMEATEAGRIRRDSPFAPLRKLMPRLWMLASPGAEQSVADDLTPDVDRFLALTEQLEAEGVDWLIVDCPPRMDAWGWTGLRLCNEVLLPMQPEFFSMHGLSQMMETLRTARGRWRGKAALLGVLVTMLDVREAIGLEVVEDLRHNLGAKLLQTVILRDSRLVEAASHGQTLFEYDLDAVGAHCYGELVRELMNG